MTARQWLRCAWTWIRWRIAYPLVTRKPLSRKGSERPVAGMLREEVEP